MKKTALTLALVAIPASFALAQEAGTFGAVDTDGDGMVALADLQTAYTIDEAGFTAIDTNADGSVDQAEFDAAVAAGTLVPTAE